MAKPPRSKTVHSLDRGLEILKAVSRANRPIGITELGQELGVAKGSISRMVTTLAQQKFLTRDPETAKYRLGIRLWELGHRVATRPDLADAARPVLEQLRDATRETVHVAILTADDKMVFLESLKTPRAVGPSLLLGLPYPCYCTANGKAMLAFLPEQERERILRGKRPRYTSATITRKEELLAELGRIRRLGYAINRGEYRPDVCGVAAPVLDRAGAAIAVIGVSVPTTRVTPQLIRNLGGLVTKGARKLASSLGA